MNRPAEIHLDAARARLAAAEQELERAMGAISALARGEKHIVSAAVQAALHKLAAAQEHLAKLEVLLPSDAPAPKDDAP